MWGNPDEYHGAALVARNACGNPITLISGGTPKWRSDRFGGRNDAPCLDTPPSTPTFPGNAQVFRKIPVV